MKQTLSQFTIVIFFLILLSISNINSNANATKIQATSKAKTKDNKTLLQMMGMAPPAKKAKGKGKVTKSKEEPRDPFLPVERRDYDNNKLINKFEKLEVMMSGWCKVSSPLFKNKAYFPKVTLPDFSQHSIQTGEDDFRLNEFWSERNEGKPGNPPNDLYFWCRYSDKFLYYTANDKSLSILGSINIRSMANIEEDMSKSDTNCLKLYDDANSQLSICLRDKKTKIRWSCRMKSDIGIAEDDCKNLEVDDVTPTIIEQKVTQPIIVIPLPSKECNEFWNYKKQGNDWNCDCSEGKEQSPIDLPEGNFAVSSPVKPIFNYDTIVAKQTQDSFDGFLRTNEYMKIFYDHGLIKIKHPNMGNVITLDGSVYKAQEIIFHTPAEHTIKGKKYDMEVQIVHYGQTKGDIAKQLVVSFMVESRPGVYNKFFDEVDYFNLPGPMNLQVDLTTNLFIPKIFYEVEEKAYPIMKNFSFYTYKGSLTSPPCTERTIHLVASKPIKLSTTTITLFKEALKVPDTIDELGNVTQNTDSATLNARGTQALAGRVVYFYNSDIFDGPEPPKVKARQNGHFERMKKKYIQYIHVAGNEPSGLPGAFVVSKDEAKGN